MSVVVAAGRLVLFLHISVFVGRLLLIKVQPPGASQTTLLLELAAPFAGGPTPTARLLLPIAASHHFSDPAGRERWRLLPTSRHSATTQP